MSAFLKSILPARFLCLTCHLSASILILYEKSGIIKASLPLLYSASEYTSIERSIDAVTWLSIIFLSIEIIGLFLGTSAFSPFICGFSTASHFVGTILICYCMRENWQYYTLWYTWVFFCCIPLVFELFAFIRVFCFRRIKY